MTQARTRRQVEVRREEILLAAIGEVERVGLAAVRVSDVAAALGISTGLVFYHFGTKDELVAEAFTYAVERDLAAMDRAAARRGSALDRCVPSCASTGRRAAPPAGGCGSTAGPSRSTSR